MMRATTLKVGKAGVRALIGYYAGLAADQLRRDGTIRGPVTTTSTPTSRRDGGGATAVPPWSCPERSSPTSWPPC